MRLMRVAIRAYERASERAPHGPAEDSDVREDPVVAEMLDLLDQQGRPAVSAVLAVCRDLDGLHDDGTDERADFLRRELELLLEPSPPRR